MPVQAAAASKTLLIPIDWRVFIKDFRVSFDRLCHRGYDVNLAIMPRPEEEMPMIGHEAIGGDANLGLSVSLSENSLKRGV